MEILHQERDVKSPSHVLILGAWPLEFVFYGSIEYCRHKLAVNSGRFTGSPWRIAQIGGSFAQAGRIQRLEDGRLVLTDQEANDG